MSLIETTGGGTVYSDGPSAGKLIAICNPLLNSAAGATKNLLWECRDFGITPKTRTAGIIRRINNIEYLIVPGQITFVSPMKVINLGDTMKTVKVLVKKELGPEYYWEPGVQVGARQTLHIQIQGFSLLKAGAGEGPGSGDSLWIEIEEGSQFQVYVMGSEAVVLEHQRNTKED